MKTIPPFDSGIIAQLFLKTAFLAVVAILPIFHKKNCKSAIIPIDADTGRDYNYIRELITMAELPGNVHEKIGDLRIEKGLTKKQVSEDLGIPASQLTRIENEDIKSIGHELVIKFADYFGVSTDYLLGKPVSEQRKM